MRLKREIERQLEHFQNGKCHHTGSPENEIWIKALEWVLGDPDHQNAYAEWLKTLDEFIKTNDSMTSGELVQAMAYGKHSNDYGSLAR